MTKLAAILGGVLALVLFGVDRISKLLIIKTGITFGGPVFYVEPSRNIGGAFSAPLPLWFLIVFSLIAILVLVWWAYAVYKHQQYFKLLGVGLMLIGGMSNLLDRLQGGVVDIFYISTGLSFNVSDVYLVIGLGIIVFGKNNKTLKPKL